DFDLRTETIHRKGAASETHRVFFNDVGILDVDPSEPGESSRGAQVRPSPQRLHLSFAWTGAGSGAALAVTCWLDLLSSASVAEAMGVVRGCPLPTLSFAFADRDGHIGRQASGR